MEIINPEAPVRLKRSRYEHMIAGVCGGLGKFIGIDPVIIRLIWLGLFLAFGVGLLIYILSWVIIPVELEETTQS